MDINKYLVPEDISVAEAVRRIDEGKKKVVFCLRDGRLSGCFTDGDMRRYILRDGNMENPVSRAMNPHPIVFSTLQEAEALAGGPVRLALRVGELPKASPEENLKNLLAAGRQYQNIEIK